MLKIRLICFLGCLLQSGATLPEQIFLIVCLFVVHLFCMCSVCCFVTEDGAMASKNSLATLLLLFVEEILFRGEALFWRRHFLNKFQSLCLTAVLRISRYPEQIFFIVCLLVCFYLFLCDLFGCFFVLFL